MCVKLGPAGLSFYFLFYLLYLFIYLLLFISYWSIHLYIIKYYLFIYLFIYLLIHSFIYSSIYWWCRGSFFEHQKGPQYVEIQIVGQFCNAFLLRDRKIWFTCISKVLRSVCKTWSPEAILSGLFRPRKRPTYVKIHFFTIFFSGIWYVSANTGLVFALMIYKGHIKGLSSRCVMA